MALLRKWRSKHGPCATYKRLAECFYSACNLGMVEEICKVVRGSTSVPVQPSYSNTQNQQQAPEKPPFGCGCGICRWDHCPFVVLTGTGSAHAVASKWTYLPKQNYVQHHTVYICSNIINIPLTALEGHLHWRSFDVARAYNLEKHLLLGLNYLFAILLLSTWASSQDDHLSTLEFSRN